MDQGWGWDCELWRSRGEETNEFLFDNELGLSISGKYPQV